MPLLIRRAKREEASALTALTLRSKAHWGYDDSFMADAKTDPTFDSSAYDPDWHV